MKLSQGIKGAVGQGACFGCDDADDLYRTDQRLLGAVRAVSFLVRPDRSVSTPVAQRNAAASAGRRNGGAARRGHPALLDRDRCFHPWVGDAVIRVGSGFVEGVAERATGIDVAGIEQAVGFANPSI